MIMLWSVAIYGYIYKVPSDKEWISIQT
jgi:hypothetical protein